MITKQTFIKAASAVGAIASLFGAVFVFEDRYANAQEMEAKIASQEQRIEFLQQNMQTTSQKILDFLKAQAITRKTVLEMKEDSGSLTSDERVELRNLRETLKTIQ